MIGSRSWWLHTLLALGVAVFTSTPAMAQGKTEVKADGWGSLSGTVTLKGAIPEPQDLTAVMNTNADAKCCLAGTKSEKEKQTWVVNSKNKGIANVFVYLRPADPAKQYFPVDDKDKATKNDLVIDQPHCQFIPHAAAFYPSYFDGKKQVPTGQKMVVKNSSTVAHNVRGTGSIKLGNPGFNFNVIAGDSKVIPKLNPQPLPVVLQCDIHNWMMANVMVFDHPYFAITDADGNFTIPRVPAGAELTIMAWHEGSGYALTKDGVKTTFKTGQNSHDFQISPK